MVELNTKTLDGEAQLRSKLDLAVEGLILLEGTCEQR